MKYSFLLEVRKNVTTRTVAKNIYGIDGKSARTSSHGLNLTALPNR